MKECRIQTNCLLTKVDTLKQKTPIPIASEINGINNNFRLLFLIAKNKIKATPNSKTIKLKMQLRLLLTKLVLS